MENYKNYGNKKSNIEYESDPNGQPTFDQRIQEIQIDLHKASKQCRLEILGIEVYFPYTPYDCQILYMKKVIEACNTKSLAALESPTGTGKTLCLLCASLGWLRAKRKEMTEKIKTATSTEEKVEQSKNIPFIFYSSRTHSQITNVIKELKKTCYLPHTSILSSRDNMCVNAAVKNFSGNMLNIKCKQVRMRKECKYFFGSEKLNLYSYDNLDIEELFTLGQKSTFCPFYFQRNKKEIADIVFLPYNYIFDHKLRKILKIELTNSILLIDEAHNIETVCESSKSFELSTKIIDECLNELKSLKLLLESTNSVLNKDSVLKEIHPDKIKEQESILNSIKAYLKTFQVKSGTNWPNMGLKLSPKDLFDIFFEGSKTSDRGQTVLTKSETNSSRNSTITPDNISYHAQFIKTVETGISDELGRNSSTLSSYADLLEMISTLSSNYLMFVKSGDKNPNNCFINNFKLFINDVEDFSPSTEGNFKKDKYKGNYSNMNAKSRTLFLFCFNPGFGFKDILDAKAHSIIITSGTLSPMDGVEAELKCNFKIKLENTHVIEANQVNFAIQTNSFKTKIPFRFDANNKGNTSMLEELGNTICDYTKITPGGILVFFTSYHFLNTCIGIWAEKEILSEIEKNKEIFKDMHDSNKNKIVLKNFTEACQQTNNNPKLRKKGGILFSVCRGTSSEGIDFSDDIARMVIIVGIPYPNLGDVKVNLKKEYLEEFNSKNISFLDKSIKKLSGSEWYSQNATRAVNQAMGRVVRHVDDYGSMILIDQRYKEFLYKKAFSAWLRPAAKIYEDNKLITFTKNFFDGMPNFIREKQYQRKQNPRIINTIVNLDSNCLNTNCVNNNDQTTSINKNDHLKRKNENNFPINRTQRSETVLNDNDFQIFNDNINQHAEEESLENILLKNQNALIKRGKPSEITPVNQNNMPQSSNGKNSLIDTIQNNMNRISNLTQNISNNINNINKVTYGNTNINISSGSNIVINNINIHATKQNLANNTVNISNNQNSIKFQKKAAYTYTELNIIESSPSVILNNSFTNNSNVIEKNNIIDKKSNQEDDIFNGIEADDLMNLINDNIGAFENEEANKETDVPILNISHGINSLNNSLTNFTNNINLPLPNPGTKSGKKLVIKDVNRTDSSSKKIKGQLSMDLYLNSSAKKRIDVTNIPINYNITTPTKMGGPKEEIRSDAIIRKLLELKDRSQLDSLLQKYNLKLTDVGEGGEFSKGKTNSNENKKTECPICYEFDNNAAKNCGHVLCQECWENIFKYKYECPICKKKCRPNTLIPIFV